MAALLANMVDAELEHARHARAFQDSAMDKHMPKDEIRDYAPNEKDDILYLLEEVNRTARRTFDALIVGLDLNQTQWRIIASLLREPTLTQTEISRLFELESATIGQAVAVLVEKGLIERERAAHDRRVWNLHLTEQVRTIWPELREAADRLHETLWKGMSAPQIDFLRAMLRKVAENQKQADTCEASR
mgnify:FL=1